MTLCIVWRTSNNINFTSDSRLTLNSFPVDVCIKIVRVPFNIYAVGDPGQPDPIVLSGDLGMTSAGASTVALMVKDALAEVVRDVQGIPDYHVFSMDQISDLIFRGFRSICREFSIIMADKSAVSTIFAGYCCQKSD